MYRQFVVRSTRPTVYLDALRPSRPIASRTLTTAPQPPPEKSPYSHSHPEGSNTLIILSALGALGGLYYYYTRGNPAADREAARRKEEELERKVREFGDAGKSKIESAAQQGQRDLSNIKNTSSAVHGRAVDAGAELSERARKSAYDAQAKLGDLKGTAKRKMSDARDRSEKTIEEAKEEVEAVTREAEKKTGSWFGWGSSK